MIARSRSGLTPRRSACWKRRSVVAPSPKRQSASSPATVPSSRWTIGWYTSVKARSLMQASISDRTAASPRGLTTRRRPESRADPHRLGADLGEVAVVSMRRRRRQDRQQRRGGDDAQAQQDAAGLRSHVGKLLARGPFPESYERGEW